MGEAENARHESVGLPDDFNQMSRHTTAPMYGPSSRQSRPRVQNTYLMWAAERRLWRKCDWKVISAWHVEQLSCFVIRLQYGLPTYMWAFVLHSSRAHGVHWPDCADSRNMYSVLTTDKIHWTSLDKFHKVMTLAVMVVVVMVMVCGQYGLCPIWLNPIELRLT